MSMKATDWTGSAPEQMLRALGNEFNHSLHALALGTLEALEESLWRQQLLCADLQKLVEKGHLPSGTDLPRLRSAAASLAEPQRQLAGVLEQASASAAVLHRLCSSYQDTRSVGLQTSVLI